MSRIVYKVLLIIASLGIFYFLGLNAVKLLLLIIPQIFGLSESINSNKLASVLLLAVIAPSLAGVLTYHFLNKYILIRWSDKRIKVKDAQQIIKKTLIIASSLVALINFFLEINR